MYEDGKYVILFGRIDFFSPVYDSCMSAIILFLFMFLVW